MIQTSNGQGTGFTLDINGRQYLITAKHMVTGLQPEDTIQLRKYDASHQLKWVDFKMKIFKCDDPVDIAVLVPREQLTAAAGPMDPILDVMTGQDVFFVGFPKGMSNEFVDATFVFTSPFGYVKRAVVSGLKVTKIGRKLSVEYFLDGLNIGGFSGSPMVYRPSGNGELQVLGVITSFTPDYGPVLTPREIRPEEATPEDKGKGRIVTTKDRHTYRLEEPTDMKDERYVMLNSGIAHADGIQSALDLIQLHQDGPKIAADFRPALAP
jgi:hypothetical protein